MGLLLTEMQLEETRGNLLSIAVHVSFVSTYKFPARRSAGELDE